MCDDVDREVVLYASHATTDVGLRSKTPSRRAREPMYPISGMSILAGRARSRSGCLPSLRYLHDKQGMVVSTATLVQPMWTCHLGCESNGRSERFRKSCRAQIMRSPLLVGTLCLLVHDLAPLWNRVNLNHRLWMAWRKCFHLSVGLLASFENANSHVP
jgi:hypothetical protein